MIDNPIQHRTLVSLVDSRKSRRKAKHTWLPSNVAKVPVLVSFAFHLAELQILIFAISHKVFGIGLRSRHLVARFGHTQTATSSLGSNDIDAYVVMRTRGIPACTYTTPITAVTGVTWSSILRHTT